MFWGEINCQKCPQKGFQINYENIAIYCNTFLDIAIYCNTFFRAAIPSPNLYGSSGDSLLSAKNTIQSGGELPTFPSLPTNHQDLDWHICRLTERISSVGTVSDPCTYERDNFLDRDRFLGFSGHLAVLDQHSWLWNHCVLLQCVSNMLISF